MEEHKCDKLEELIAARKEKFKESVMAQKCVASKIIQI